MRVANPIRRIMDTIEHPKDAPQEFISLSIGDPTVFGNLKVHQQVKDSLCRIIQSDKCNGYFNAAGSSEARRAVAKRFSSTRSQLTEGDIILTSGCSGALEIAMAACANPGDNLLIPKPGFSLYTTICAHLGVEIRYYDLLPDSNWEIDLAQMESLVDERTCAILVNNPSNPCGSVWSRAHIEAILRLVSKLDVPLISDEVYADMVFDGHTFYSFGEVSEDVPVIVVGGIAKRYLVPGWRVGWIIIHDRDGRLEELKTGMYKLGQLILGANTLVQSAIPEMLEKTPTEFYEETNRMLQTHATYLVDRISKIPGLSIIVPGGAMYVMVRVEINQLEGIQGDVDFTQKLLLEENVFVLPGTIFGAPNFVRLVVCPPLNKLESACDRLALFCSRHRSPASSS
eukprot:TRINITY_DN1342_c0_g1_i5.p2 TRINITY_DN1342_c0_g1~~TRINITY_DN1342_c0_g1_i5.p2  ORF type:complete len:399 (+),score=43.76 TRINITY_DN1342_c0_g1_i5:1387-2583(+)